MVHFSKLSSLFSSLLTKFTTFLRLVISSELYNNISHSSPLLLFPFVTISPLSVIKTTELLLFFFLWNMESWNWRTSSFGSSAYQKYNFFQEGQRDLQIAQPIFTNTRFPCKTGYFRQISSSSPLTFRISHYNPFDAAKILKVISRSMLDLLELGMIHMDALSITALPCCMLFSTFYWG